MCRAEDKSGDSIQLKFSGRGSACIGLSSGRNLHGLSCCNLTATRSTLGAATITANRSLRGDMPDFLIWVPEIDAFYNEVTAKGARIQLEIIQRAYSREFIIEDFDGHCLHV